MKCERRESRGSQEVLERGLGEIRGVEEHITKRRNRMEKGRKVSAGRDFEEQT